MDWTRFTPVAPDQREYVASHPLAYWFSLGIALVGIVSLVSPSLVDQTAASLALPFWLQIAFRIIWTIGGSLAWSGIAFGKPRFEGAGMALLAAGLLVNFAATMRIRPGAVGGSLFVLTLAVGCALRAHHLVAGSYSPAAQDWRERLVSTDGPKQDRPDDDR